MSVFGEAIGAIKEALKLAEDVKRTGETLKELSRELRDILESAVRPTVALGSALLAIGRSLGGIELPTRRDPTPVDGAHYE